MVMLTEKKKIGLTVFFSAFVTLVVFSALFELYESIKFDKWRSSYKENGDWYFHLTVASENERLMWEYRPNGQIEYDVWGILNNTLKTNSYGFRDYNYGVNKPSKTTYRMAFVGDSVTLGLGVSFNDIFVKRFEREAQRLNPKVNIQAMNFSVDGYNTVQIKEMVKAKVLKFSPDKIVYVMSLNDFDFEDASGSKIRYFKKPKSFLFERIKKLYRIVHDIEYHEYHFSQNKSEVFQTILEMKSLLDKERIAFSVAILPVFDFSVESFDTYSQQFINDEINSFLTDNKIDHLDLLDGFQRQNKAPSFFAYDIWHPNKEGHKIITRILLEKLAYSG